VQWVTNIKKSNSEMFRINKYEHAYLEEEKQFFRIDFTYLGETSRRVKFKLYEDLTKCRWMVIGGITNVKKNVNYWISDEYPHKFESIYNNDLILKIVDCETDEVIFEKFLKTSSTNINKRSLGSNFDKKNTWVIGDSHTNHFMSYGLKYDVNLFQTNSTIINPAAFPLLSINRFVNIDYLKLLGSFPIFDGDDICFFIGEIDTRVGIIRNSKLKNKTNIEQLTQLVARFIDVIKKIKEKYPTNKIYYILPNGPIRTDFVEESKRERSFDCGTEKQRFLVRNMFEELIISEMKKIDVKVFDIYKNYLDDDGYVDGKYLIEGDHHFKTPNTFLSSLKELF